MNNKLNSVRILGDIRFIFASRKKSFLADFWRSYGA